MSIEQRLEVLEREVKDIQNAARVQTAEHTLQAGANVLDGVTLIVGRVDARRITGDLFTSPSDGHPDAQSTHDSDTKDDPATCLLNALVAFIRSEVKKTTPNEVAIDGAVDAILKKSLLAHAQLSKAIILYEKLVQDKFEQSRASFPC